MLLNSFFSSEFLWVSHLEVFILFVWHPYFKIAFKSIENKKNNNNKWECIYVEGYALKLLT